MDDLLDRQRRRNAESRDRWELHADHRRRVTALALSVQGGPGRRLCVLGAGNCNDLELVGLLNVYREVHLVDLDRAALEAGVARQQVARFPGLRLHGGIDLTGALSAVPKPPAQADGEAAERLIEALAAGSPALPAGPFEVVLSSCVYTQLLEPVIAALGAGHPRLAEALATLRRRHLELMLDLAAPGGAVVMVSDMVSSDSVPGLGATPPDQVKDLMAGLVRERNFFSGANPLALLQALGEPALGERIARADVIEPWIWPLSEARSYLVYALRLRLK